jgi:putative transport protein
MIAGIAISALRARLPALGGPVPESVRRMFEDVGVVIFVAVLGLNTGATLPAAFATGNLGHLLIAIVIVAFVPVLLGWVVGIYLFKVNAAILLGAIAGANQNSAALKTAEESTHSEGPALGFPVAFAVGTLALAVAAYIVALIE